MNDAGSLCVCVCACLCVLRQMNVSVGSVFWSIVCVRLSLVHREACGDGNEWVLLRVICYVVTLYHYEASAMMLLQSTASLRGQAD